MFYYILHIANIEVTNTKFLYWMKTSISVRCHLYIYMGSCCLINFVQMDSDRAKHLVFGFLGFLDQQITSSELDAAAKESLEGFGILPITDEL